jgi:hypothetical protein
VVVAYLKVISCHFPVGQFLTQDCSYSSDCTQPNLLSAEDAAKLE